MSCLVQKQVLRSLSFHTKRRLVSWQHVRLGWHPPSHVFFWGHSISFEPIYWKSVRGTTPICLSWSYFTYYLTKYHQIRQIEEGARTATRPLDTEWPFGMTPTIGLYSHSLRQLRKHHIFRNKHFDQMVLVTNHGWTSCNVSLLSSQIIFNRHWCTKKCLFWLVPARLFLTWQQSRS